MRNKAKKSSGSEANDFLEALETMDGASTTVTLVESRVAARAISAMTSAAALPRPDLSTVGAGYRSAFDDWVASIVSALSCLDA